MIEQMQKLTSAELERIAGEVLRSLAAAGAKAPQTAQADTPALPQPQRPFSETTPLPVRVMPQDGGFGGAQTVSPTERFADNPLPFREAHILSRTVSVPAVQTQDAEALSDFFRRDSRRYDGGFEKF